MSNKTQTIVVPKDIAQYKVKFLELMNKEYDCTKYPEPLQKVEYLMNAIYIYGEINNPAERNRARDEIHQLLYNMFKP